jgi:hypothetical protein
VSESGPRDLPAAEIALQCARLGDAEVARLLSSALLPALQGQEPAATLVRSAVARLVRADAGALPTRASTALAAAVAAVAARTPAPIVPAGPRALRVWRPPTR